MLAWWPAFAIKPPLMICIITDESKRTKGVKFIMPLPKVTILLPGYLSSQTQGRTCATISLVQEGNLKIIVDPGTVAHEKVITESLRKQGLSIDDIDIVFITHAHTDHYKSCGLFPKAKILDYWGWWQGDKGTKAKSQISKNISIIKTPGHSYDSLTMLVKTEKSPSFPLLQRGMKRDFDIVALCGDVFWTSDIRHQDPYAQDKLALKKSREKVLKMADWIVPGHANLFKVEK